MADPTAFNELQDPNKTFVNVRENATIYQDSPVIYDPVQRIYVRAKQPMTDIQGLELLVLGEILFELKRIRTGMQILSDKSLEPDEIDD